MTARLARLVAAAAALAAPLAVAAQERNGAAQERNGEAYATTPEVVREVYDMRAAMAPIALGERELKGRALFAQRCANCHGGTRQRPGPLLGKQTVEKLGEAAFREKVRQGSAMMPGFQHTLQPPQIDQIAAFLTTFTARTQPAGAQE